MNLAHVTLSLLESPSRPEDELAPAAASCSPATAAQLPRRDLLPDRLRRCHRLRRHPLPRPNANPSCPTPPPPSHPILLWRPSPPPQPPSTVADANPSRPLPSPPPPSTGGLPPPLLLNFGELDRRHLRQLRLAPPPDPA
jgi:hypothetical protein